MCAKRKWIRRVDMYPFFSTRMVMARFSLQAPECKQLIQRLKDASDCELIHILKDINTWYYGKVSKLKFVLSWQWVMNHNLGSWLNKYQIDDTVERYRIFGWLSRNHILAINLSVRKLIVIWWLLACKQWEHNSSRQWHFSINAQTIG